MSPDAQTIAFYDREAAAYAGYAAGDGDRRWLERFAARLAPGAAVLDLGCGSGWAAHALGELGFAITALDASAGLAAEAQRRYGIEVTVADFASLDAVAALDGIWASFSLLHEPRAAMAGHLGRIRRALAAGGWLYLGLKAGEGEARDRLGRLYTYWGPAEIADLLAAAGFTDIEAAIDAGGAGYDGTPAALLHILARAPA